MGQISDKFAPFSFDGPFLLYQQVNNIDIIWASG